MGSITLSQATCFEREKKGSDLRGQEASFRGSALPFLPPLGDSGLLTLVKFHVPWCTGLELLRVGAWCMHCEQRPQSWLAPRSLFLLKTSLGFLPAPGPCTLAWQRGVRNPADSRGPWPCWPVEGPWITPVRSVPPPARKCDLTRTFRNMFPLHVSPFILPKLYCICQIFSWLRTSGYENWDFLLCSPSLSCFYSFGGHK